MSADQATQQIMEVIIRTKGCLLDEIVFECPTLTWNQVFLEIDRLSRNGQVQLRSTHPGTYIVEPTQHDQPTKEDSIDVKVS